MTTKVTSSDHCGSPDELRKWADFEFANLPETHAKAYAAADAWEEGDSKLASVILRQEVRIMELEQVERAAKELAEAIKVPVLRTRDMATLALNRRIDEGGPWLHAAWIQERMDNVLSVLRRLVGGG